MLMASSFLCSAAFPSCSYLLKFFFVLSQAWFIISLPSIYPCTKFFFHLIMSSDAREETVVLPYGVSR